MDLSKVEVKTERIANEKKWQKVWEETGLYKFDKSRLDDKEYVLEMFSYPSGAKLHVGHWYNYGPTDSYARFERMNGKNVFHPVGFDAFGLPAENYAIKTGIHPKDSTLKNIETMETQLKNIGASFDWDTEVKTCAPDYYKWTQWMFLQLYKNGLAYRKEAPVNWCPSCNTVLANEQVLGDGTCERCGTTVVRKNLTQWFFRITKYAEELLSGLDTLDWPEKTKLMQKNWIGKSVGGEVEFKLENGKSFRVFTTRADTLFGVSYVVLAPEHALVAELTTPEHSAEVNAYIAECAKASEIDRVSTSREKTGCFTGSYAINPVNGKKVPVWIADYVLCSYGTGAVMGVPAHDERDFAFAKKYNLPVTRVIAKPGVPADAPETERPDALPFCEDGVLVASGDFDGLSSEEARKGILSDLEKKNAGGFKINYRLRDWLISRQRYWGAPIPIVYCEHCGEVPVPEEQLPVELPYDVEFKPDGKSPLAKCESFVNTVCPVCGRPARRDVDTLDTFVCSSWYFLRYPDSKNDKAPFDKEYIDKILPVDKYVGGAEHACMHLLYARFFVKALRDMGYLNFDEPFLSLVHQGTILGPDGQKMSKSKGNVISPDDFIKVYGSDTFRMYLMFGFSYVEGGPWSDDGIDAISKFMDRVERYVRKVKDAEYGEGFGKAEKELDYARNYCIKAMTADMKSFSFNTAIARLMEFVNALYKYDNEKEKNTALVRACMRDLVLLVAPIAPHFAEELWQEIGGGYSVFDQRWPSVNEKALVKSEVEIAVQLNGKIKCKLVVASGIKGKEGEELILAIPEVQKLLEGKTPKKVIIVPDRIVNIVL